MAEHVRFHMTSVPVSGSIRISPFSYRRKERERKREERWRERVEKGLIREKGFWLDFQAPASCQLPPISARHLLEGFGTQGDRLEREVIGGMGVRTPELKAARLNWPAETVRTGWWRRRRADRCKRICR